MSLHTYPSEMALNFWTAIVSWSVCFFVTVAITLATQKNKTDDELRGLVYSLTKRETGDDHLAWYARPAALAVFVLVITVALNYLFW